jgi:DNA-directed RNA polymerase I, II, and III subunit RPABC2
MDETEEPEQVEPVEENENEDTNSIVSDEAEDDEVEQIIEGEVDAEEVDAEEVEEVEEDDEDDGDDGFQKDDVDEYEADELNTQNSSYKNSFLFNDNLEASDSDQFLQKFGDELKNDFIATNHQECLSKNMDEIKEFLDVVRDKDNIIIDKLHRTIPILTKYEKTRIIGIRLKQLNNGAEPYIKVAEDIIDNNYIAEKELKDKKIPFIIQRPIANNTFEYWRVEDLEIL